MTTEAPAVPSAPPAVDQPAESTTAFEPVAPVQEAKEPEAKEEDPKVLDLTSLAPTRRLVKLPTAEHPEGENFELRLLDDFGIADQQKLLKWSRTYERLFNSEEDLDDEAQADADARLKFVLDSLFDKALDAPKAVKAAMPDGVRSRVMTAFSLAPLIAQQERAQEAQRAKEEEEEAKEKEAEENSENRTSQS